MKPQDVVVMLKLHLSQNLDWTQPKIAKAIGLSQSETSDAIKRCERSGLYSPLKAKPVRSAMEEFFVHGIKYCFPATLGMPERGLPTAYSAPPLSEMLAIVNNNEMIVWPYAEGKVRGTSLEPLYKSVPIAALADIKLYECLALIDAIRVGRAREKTLAAKLLIDRIRFKES